MRGWKLAALGAVLAGLVAVLLIAGGGDGYRVQAEFINASQLVPGNEVVAADVAIGSVSEIELAPDNRALVTLEIDPDHAPLPQGVEATVRSGSLATVAGRRVELSYPPTSTGGIPDGGRLPQTATTSQVEIDAVLDALRPESATKLRRVLRGLRDPLVGVERQANVGAATLNPLISTSRRVLGQVSKSRRDFESLIVDGSKLSGALSLRDTEIASLIANLDLVLGTIGDRRTALSEAVRRLPPVLRQANTTLVNLRAAADDLDPLLVATLPVARRAGSFFAELRAASADAVPAIRDLDGLIRRRGADNDLVELTRRLPALEEIAVGSGRPQCGDGSAAQLDRPADDDFTQGAFGEAVCATRNSLAPVGFLRPYSQELIGWFDDFSTTGTLDANGGIGRIAGTFNAFSAAATNGIPELLSPIDPVDLYNDSGGDAVPLIDIGNTQRCPGALERDPGDGSVPFTDDGTLNCDPTQGPTGP